MHVASLVVVGLAAAQAPLAFVAGDPARLKCRVVKVEPATKDAAVCLLTVEVSNPTTTAAEPLAFEVSSKRLKAPVRLARALHPAVYRAGRAVPAGSKRSYWLQAVRHERDLEAPAVRVTDASFFEGAGVDASPVKVGAIRHETVEEAGRRATVSVVELENTRADRVDVVLDLQCDEPWRGRSLARVRLEPSAKTTWRAVDAFGDFGRVDGGVAAKVTAAKVVDWSVEPAPPAGGDPDADFVAAWDGWLRRPADAPPVTGRFELEEESREQPGAPPRRARAAGTFRMDARAGLTFTPDAPLDAATTNDLKAAFQRAFDAVSRKPAAEVLAAKGAERVARGLYRLEARHSGEAQFARLMSVRGARFTGWTVVDSDAIRETWTTAPLGDGYVVTRMEGWQAALAELTDVQTFEFALDQGLVVPTLHTKTWKLGAQGAASTSTLRLRPAAAAAAAGAAAEPVPLASRVPEPVRKAWNATWRYPGKPVTLTGAFVVESPATDALWQGHRRLAGRFTLQGFRGWLGDGSRWESAKFDFETPADPSAREALGGVVEDRFRLWAFRDIAGREQLEQMFASAAFARVPDRPDVWQIKNAPWSSVELRDGLIAAYTADGGTRRTIEYAKVGGGMVPARIRTGDEELLATFTDLGGGWLVPSRLEFRRVFRKDWGPETLTFTDLKIVE